MKKSYITAGLVAAMLVFGAGWWTGHRNTIREETRVTQTTTQQHQQTNTQQASTTTTQQQQSTATTDHSTTSATTSTTQNAKVTTIKTKVTKKDGTVIERERVIVDNSKHDESKVDTKKDVTTKTDSKTDTTASTSTNTQQTTDTKTETKVVEKVVEKPVPSVVTLKLYAEQDLGALVDKKKLDVKLNFDADVRVWGPLFIGGSLTDITSPTGRGYAIRAGIQVTF